MKKENKKQVLARLVQTPSKRGLFWHGTLEGGHVRVVFSKSIDETDDKGRPVWHLIYK